MQVRVKNYTVYGTTQLFYLKGGVDSYHKKSYTEKIKIKKGSRVAMSKNVK